MIHVSPLPQIAEVLHQTLAEQWKTTIDLLCMNQQGGNVEAGKIIRFIGDKPIVAFHSSACLLQDLYNLRLQV